ncbi:hypothetical protein TNCT_387031, partial [Trichonephila clavata]
TLFQCIIEDMEYRFIIKNFEQFKEKSILDIV